MNLWHFLDRNFFWVVLLAGVLASGSCESAPSSCRVRLSPSEEVQATPSGVSL